MTTEMLKLRQRMLKIQEKRKEGIAKKVKSLRIENGLKQEELAFHLGLTRTSVVNIENGKQSLTMDTLFGIFDTFDITPNDFFEGIDK